MLRERNEDNYRTVTDKQGVPEIFIIADGMGGHSSGDIASKKAVEFVERALSIKKIWKSKEQNALDNIVEAMQKANTALFALAENDEKLAGMGTTMIAALFLEGRIYIGHVGDSRLYRIRNSEIEQITLDHSLVEALVNKGKITRAEARDYPGKNIITRALGAYEDIQIDTYFLDVEQNDKFIMCTDGLTNKLKDDEMAEIILNSEKLEAACGNLTEEANKRGGEDNITVIIVNCN